MVSKLYTYLFLIFIQPSIGEGALNGGKGEKGPPQRKEEVIISGKFFGGYALRLTVFENDD